MTNSPSTDATPRPWSYEIQYGPNGEEIYAWVYYLNFMVCTVKVHHAKMIVEAVNAYESLKARLAEVEKDRDRARDCHEETAQKLHSYMRLHAAAESRCAELVKALEPVVTLVADYIKHRMYGDNDLVVGRVPTPKDQMPPSITFGDLRRVATLAAEQKEAGE